MCQKLGIRFYATEEQLELTTNKEKFKEQCRNSGFPVLNDYIVSMNDDIQNINCVFPVIIKPVDNYGSKGITVCEDKSSLKKAMKSYVIFKNETVIVEEL